MHDAYVVREGLTTYASLYIRRGALNHKLYLMTRTFYYEVDWEAHYEVTPEQARALVRLGLADWSLNVPEELKHDYVQEEINREVVKSVVNK